MEPEGLTNNGVFRFTRLGSNSTSLNFTFSLSGNTTNGIDYTTVATTTNFTAGSNILDIIIMPKTNNIFTGPRQVIATISTNAAAYTITNGSASVLLIDNDLPSVQVVTTDSDARETGPKAGKFSLLRTGSTASALTVSVGISGTALNSNDYTFLTNVFVIPSGTNRLEISVTPIADALMEASETVIMTLKGSSDYSIGITNAGTVFIDDSNATSFTWTEIKQASAYPTSPFAIDSPGIVEIYRTGSCRLATNFPYQIYNSSGTLNMSLMRVSGNVTNNQIRFEANSNLARVFLTAALANNTDNNAGGYFAISNLFMASSFPIHFLSSDRFVRISILQTNAVEGTTTVAKLRATRLTTGSALNTTFSVMPNGTAAASSYNMTNSGILALGTTALTGDYNISANADSFVQGWRSLVLSIPINDSTIAYELPEEYLLFIRDNVTDPTLLSEPDTDNDGLSDLWEQAHGLDPLAANDPNFDPDRNGLGLFDEYQLGLNPMVSDPGPDYLPIKLRVQDTGKINNGNSCAVCHTTEMRVNNYRLFAQSHGFPTEKTFYFRKGTNYPVALYEFVNNIPRPNGNTGNPTTTETYAAQFLVSKTNSLAQFFVTDPSSRLGSNKVWLTSFPTAAQNPVGTLTVPRIDITFTNVSGNTALDTNLNWNGGMRVFPDQLSPTETTARNIVRVRITTTPAMPGKQVRLKSFDVDDPTPVSLDDQFLIDTNDVGVVKGNDNRGTPQAGTLAQTLLTLDGTGAIEAQLTLPMQPGDNLRVATLFETNNAQTHLDLLQVTNANAPYYVTNSNGQIKDFVGSLSPMLTVWRRLNLEFDSMTAPPQTGTEINFWPVTITRREVLVNDSSKVRLVVQGTPQETIIFNRFENGRISIAGIGEFKILSNVNDVVSQNLAFNYLTVSPDPGTNAVGLAATLYDDDDLYLQNNSLYPSLLNLPAPLPANTRSTEFSTNMQPRFSDAYVQLVDANAMGWNTQPTIPFKNHANLPIPIFPGDFDYTKLSLNGKDRAGFWCYSVVFAYQPSASEDGDPDQENPLTGINPKYPVGSLAPNGMAVIYVEATRDAIFGIRQGRNTGPIPRDKFNNSIAAPVLTHQYLTALYGTIAHEVGHAP